MSKFNNPIEISTFLEPSEEEIKEAWKAYSEYPRTREVDGWRKSIRAALIAAAIVRKETVQSTKQTTNKVFKNCPKCKGEGVICTDTGGNIWQLMCETCRGTGSILASGCCSSINPCSHQQRDPTTICETCSKAAESISKPESSTEILQNIELTSKTDTSTEILQNKARELLANLFCCSHPSEMLTTRDNLYFDIIFNMLQSVQLNEKMRCVEITNKFGEKNRFKVSDTWKNDMTPSEVYDVAASDVSLWIEQEILGKTDA